MLHLLQGWEEYDLSERAKGYIRLYANPGDTVCYVPYIDDQDGKKKHVKFAYLNDQWVYIDNSQNS